MNETDKMIQALQEEFAQKIEAFQAELRTEVEQRLSSANVKEETLPEKPVSEAGKNRIRALSPDDLIKNLQEELSSSKEQVKELQKIKGTLLEANRDLQEQISSFEEQVEELQKIKRANRDLQEQLSSSEEQAEELQESVGTLLETNRNLQRELSATRRTVKRLEEEKQKSVKYLEDISPRDARKYKEKRYWINGRGEQVSESATEKRYWINGRGERV